MPTPRQKQDLDALRSALARFPDGASLEEIEAQAVISASQRTLMRRLAQMVADGILTKSGESRAARYSLAADAPLAEPQAVAPSPIQRDMFVPLSRAGGDILRKVTQPRQGRAPVGYNRAFLSSYRPNRTSYLTAADKARLTAISQTTDAADQTAGTHAHRILARLLIDLSWNSSRLEGNTYSLLDTQRLIEGGEAAEGKAPTDAQMILNHKAAIEFLVQAAEDIDFNRHTILNLHALLAENLLQDPGAEGRIRSIPVEIRKSVYLPLDVPQLIQESFDEMLEKARAIDDAFEQAFFIMVHLPYLQPFEDVNKRVSRLAANIPLIRRNLAPISFVDVPDETYTYGILGVYELNRVDLLKDVYMWAYERSAARYAAIRQTTGDPDPFRLRHRIALKEVVSHVIRDAMTKKDAAKYIAKWAKDRVQADERPRFIEVAETELMSIHEGSFARYQIRPTEFAAWRVVWNAIPRATTKSKGPTKRGG